MALSLDRGSFEITSYTNPCSDNYLDNIDQVEHNSFLALEEKGRAQAGLESFSDTYKENPKLPMSGVDLIQGYPDRQFAESPQITQWYNIITSWMPEVAEEWWLEQFNNTNKHLDVMPQEFWHQRIRNFIFAHEEGNRNKPLGAVALTKVYLHERHSFQNGGEFTVPLFYEIRGLVVDESRRGEGIGEALVVEALRLAIKSREGLPTFANSSNKAAVNMFKKLDGTTEEPKNFLFATNGFDLHRLLACWSAHEVPLKNLCEACPLRDNTIDDETTYYWPTDFDSAPAIESSKQRQERSLEATEVTRHSRE